MQIVIDNPPHIESIKRVFALNKRVIFTYRDKIYNPDNIVIDETLLAHEAVHSRQQGADPDGWWTRYLLDPDFRLAQEVEAYQTQYREGKRIIKDRNQHTKFLYGLAADLSCPIYGNIITFAEAVSAIKSPNLFIFKT